MNCKDNLKECMINAITWTSIGILVVAFVALTLWLFKWSWNTTIGTWWPKFVLDYMKTIAVILLLTFIKGTADTFNIKK